MDPRPHTTMSGIEVDPVYGPADAERPGEYPYTRGPVRRRCTGRSSGRCGCSPASAPPSDTNERFQELLAAGGSGLSTAFDLPTLMGRDSDDPLAVGEVGKCGVAVDTLADIELTSSPTSTSATVTTSMTINSPAPIAARDVRGARRAARASTARASAARSRTTS